MGSSSCSPSCSSCQIALAVEVLRASSAPCEPGSDRLVSIDELARLVATVAGKRLALRHDPSGPEGVRGRCSDNARVRAVLGWEPTVSLEDGMRWTYEWIAAQVDATTSLPAP